MWDDDDEYFEGDAIPESPVAQGIAVLFGVAMVLVAVFW